MPTAPKKPSDDETPEAAKSAVQAQREADPPEDAETFDHDFLVKAAGAVGYLPQEVAGALSAITKKKLTIEEARAATEAWLTAPVETDPYFEQEA